MDLSLVSIDSTMARAHHDAAGLRVDEEVLVALERAVLRGDGGRRSRIHGGSSLGEQGQALRVTVMMLPFRTPRAALTWLVTETVPTETPMPVPPYLASEYMLVEPLDSSTL